MNSSKQKSMGESMRESFDKVFWEAYNQKLIRQPAVVGHYGSWDNNTSGTRYDNSTSGTPWYGGTAQATTCMIMPVITGGYGANPAPQKAAGKTRGRWTMTVFEFVLINTKTCKVLRTALAVGKNESEALMKVVLDETERKLQEKEMLAIIGNEVGDFERYVAKVEVVNSEEE